MGGSVIAGAAIAGNTAFWGSGHGHLGTAFPQFTGDHKFYAFASAGRRHQTDERGSRRVPLGWFPGGDPPGSARGGRRRGQLPERAGERGPQPSLVTAVPTSGAPTRQYSSSEEPRSEAAR